LRACLCPAFALPLPCHCPAIALPLPAGRRQAGGRQAAGRRQAGGRQGAFFTTKQSFAIQLNRDCFIRRLADSQ